MTLHEVVAAGPLALTPAAVEERSWQEFQGKRDAHIKELYATQGCTAGLLRLQPGAHEVPHRHVSGGHHLWVLEGAIEVDGAQLDAGSYVHVPHGVAHTLRNVGDGACVLFFVYERAE